MSNKVEVLDVSTEKFKEIIPNRFKDLDEKFKKLIENEFKDINMEDYEDWLENGSVKILLENEMAKYWPYWSGKRYPDNDIPWSYDEICNIEFGSFVRLCYYGKFFKK